jgi:LacI family transcriptional regulator
MADHQKGGIHAVAALAGVSIATVSRVMSGSSTVNEHLAERVHRAAKDLDYRPNSAARGLSTGRYRIIGAVMPDVTNPYFSHVMQAVSAGAEKHDHRVVVAESRGRQDDELSICESLIGQVDGLVLIAPQMQRDDLRSLSRRNIPIVVVNRLEMGVDLPMVAVDNFTAMLQICQHLVELGHKDVVYVAGPEHSWQNRERWRAVEHAQILGISATRINTDGSLEGGHVAVEQCLKGPATALICFNDIVAAGATTAVRKAGLQVPDDISVTGFDDSMLARFIEPPLTSARSPIAELGAAAWGMLWEQVDDGVHTPVPHLSAEIVVRSSTSAARPRVP